MNKIEKIEQLLSEWKAAEKESLFLFLFEDGETIGDRIKGLEAALKILKEPPMHEDTKPCDLQGYHDWCKEFNNWEFCPKCGEALGQ